MFISTQFSTSVRQQDGYEQLHKATERLSNPQALLTLGRNWGFKCTCDMCTAAPETIAASDERRLKVGELKAEVIDFLGRGKVHGAIKLIKQVLKLLDTEGLQPLMTEHYDSLARIYWYLNDHKKSRDNARAAVELLAVHGFIELKDLELYVEALLQKYASGAD
ncbi:hypothetical protein ACHAQA_001527 [Verticillium albo-atrum]